MGSTSNRGASGPFAPATRVPEILKTIAPTATAMINCAASARAIRFICGLLQIGKAKPAYSRTRRIRARWIRARSIVVDNSSAAAVAMRPGKTHQCYHAAMRLLSLHTCVVAFLSCVCCVSLVAQSANSLESRRKALNDLLAEQWEYRLHNSPLFASFLGDKRWNDQLDDYSQEAIDKNLQETQRFLDRFE